MKPKKEAGAKIHSNIYSNEMTSFKTEELLLLQVFLENTRDSEIFNFFSSFKLTINSNTCQKSKRERATIVKY